MNDAQKDRASVAVVLSVVALIVILAGCSIVGALIEGWERTFPLK